MLLLLKTSIHSDSGDTHSVFYCLLTAPNQIILLLQQRRYSTMKATVMHSFRLVLQPAVSEDDDLKIWPLPLGPVGL